MSNMKKTLVLFVTRESTFEARWQSISRKAEACISLFKYSDNMTECMETRNVITDFFGCQQELLLMERDISFAVDTDVQSNICNKCEEYKRVTATLQELYEECKKKKILLEGYENFQQQIEEDLGFIVQCQLYNLNKSNENKHTRSKKRPRVVPAAAVSSNAVPFTEKELEKESKAKKKSADNKSDAKRKAEITRSRQANSSYISTKKKRVEWMETNTVAGSGERNKYL
jgi:hypothetical protein